MILVHHAPQSWLWLCKACYYIVFSNKHKACCLGHSVRLHVQHFAQKNKYQIENRRVAGNETWLRSVLPGAPQNIMQTPISG